MSDILSKINFEKALTYGEFTARTTEYLAGTDVNSLNEKEKQFYEFTKLNVHRTNRIHKTYKVSEELKEIIESVEYPQTWLVLTESWCGDSAQNIPHITMMTELNSNIKFVILERDSNLETMDMFLTNGKSRSIPKLIVFDADGDVKFTWGPRPKEAQELVNKLQLDGLQKTEINEKLHLWYAKNRGKNIEMEIKNSLVNCLDEIRI